MNGTQKTAAGGTSFGLIAIALLFAAMSGGGGNNSRQPGPAAPTVNDATTAQESPADQDTELDPVPRIRRPLYALLNAGRVNDNKKLTQAFQDAHIGRLDFLIVTLPDPTDSSLGYTFDGALNTLQSAVGTQDFLIDRFYVPWHEHGDKTDDIDRPIYHTEPGVVQFRRRSGSKQANGTDILLVYLIGETPVAGIHQPAFDRAVAEIDELQQVHAESKVVSDESKDDAPPCESVETDKKEPRTVYVVGSTFSGSADSLARSMARARNRNFKFEVISGSASNVRTSRIEALSDGTLTSFASVRIPARLTFLAAMRYLKEIRGTNNPLRIAWLHEANTSFGTWLTDFSDAEEKSDNFSVELTAYPFPLHVSRIRSLIGEVPNEQRQLFGVPTEQQQLQLSFEHKAEAKDALPQLAPGMSNPTTELVLSRILATLKEQRFHYVGITATDSQDRVFLCERMRRYCPDVQIILDFGNRIFTHPRYRRFMKGALVASTYPMYVGNQRWSYPYLAAKSRSSDSGEPQFVRHRELAMADELQPGLFNATVLILERAMPGRHECKPLPLIDYGEPFVDSLYRHRSTAGEPYCPPLWISVIGNGTLQPLDYWPVDDMLSFEKNLLPGIKQANNGQVAGVLPKVDLPVPEQPVVLELSYTMSGKAWLIWLIGVTGIISWLVGRTRYDPTVLRPTLKRIPDEDEKQTVRGILWGLLERRIDPHLRRAQTRWLLVLIFPGWLLLAYCTVAGLVPLLAECQQVCSDTTVRNYILSIIALAAGGPALIVERFRRKQQDRLPGTSVNVGLMGVVVAVIIAACIATLSMDDSGYVVWFVTGLQLVVGTWLAAQLCALIYDAREDRCAVHQQDADSEAEQPVVSPYTDEPGSLHLWTLVTGGVLHFLALCFIAGLLDLSLTTDAPDELTGHHILWFERTFRITSGVSWVIPAALAIASTLFWALSRLSRLHMLDRKRTLPPWLTETEGRTKDKGLTESLRGLKRTHTAIESMLRDPCQSLNSGAGATVVGVFLVTILALTVIAQNATACFEGSGHTMLLWGGFACVITIWVYWMWELGLMIWLLRKLLSQVEWLPMTAAFLRVPERVRAVLGRFMVVSTPRPSHLRVRVQYLKELVEQASEYRSELRKGDWTSFKHTQFKDIDKQFATDLVELRSLEDQGSATEPTMCETHTLLNRASSQLWTGLLRDWTTRSVLENYPCSVDTEFKKTGGETGFEGWKNRAEELVAIQIRAYITSYAAQLRHLLIAAMCSTVLFLLAVLSYPLQPQSLLRSVAMIMVVTVSLIATWAIIQFDRNDFLRRIQGDRDGQFDMQLWIRTLTWLAPAIMVLLSAVFPNGWGWLGTIIEPLLTATN